jgi:hypothetical protein
VGGDPAWLSRVRPADAAQRRPARQLAQPLWPRVREASAVRLSAVRDDPPAAAGSAGGGAGADRWLPGERRGRARARPELAAQPPGPRTGRAVAWASPNRVHQCSCPCSSLTSSLARSRTFSCDHDRIFSEALRLVALLVAVALRSLAQGVLAQAITTFVGGGVGDGGPALSARLDSPSHLALDDSRNLFIADRDTQPVLRADASAFITSLAGTGRPANTEPAALTSQPDGPSSPRPARAAGRGSGIPSARWTILPRGRKLTGAGASFGNCQRPKPSTGGAWRWAAAAF